MERFVLAPVAYELQDTEANEIHAQRVTNIAIDELRKNAGLDANQAAAIVEEALAFLDARASIFTPRGFSELGGNIYIFRYRVFQEYYAATHMVDLFLGPSDRGNVSKFVGHIDDPRWLTTLQFATQIAETSLRGGAEPLIRSLIEVLARDGEPSRTRAAYFNWLQYMPIDDSLRTRLLLLR